MIHIPSLFTYFDCLPPLIILSFLNMKVSLGRATEDVKVDIDLGREGRANKISRRQVTIVALLVIDLKLLT